MHSSRDNPEIMVEWNDGGWKKEGQWGTDICWKGEGKIKRSKRKWGR